MRFFKKTQTLRANSLAAFLAVFLAAFLAVILGLTHNAGLSEFLATGTLASHLQVLQAGFFAGYRHRCLLTHLTPHLTRHAILRRMLKGWFRLACIKEYRLIKFQTERSISQRAIMQLLNEFLDREVGSMFDPNSQT